MKDCFGNFTHVGKDKDICAKCVSKKECIRKMEMSTVYTKVELAKHILSLKKEDLRL